ncbi:adenylate/guanylate cyclase domain-containing protein [Afipia birgiae]|jgi:adenylate cyclase|uniref:adenylate/guanylate cyclase domain-containing protein n=1 Tax=Afipia birgiae TaxID=151414 RepID=UPI0003049239|nr:adenylate/guanylate cyclase domain-containing protein [Afipia birgiae]MBX9819802.1 adenylate/guanylate cyclase domain-containing protein [Afipia birgiae]
MAETAASPLSRFLRGIGIRQVRLVTGLILFAYLISHFANHALGNVSLGTMDAALHYHAIFWQNWPVLIVFYGAVLTHLGLGIWALYARRQFRWTAIELTQLVFGLSIPVFIISHVVGVRIAAPLFGHEKHYPQAVFAYWVFRPYMQWTMYAVLLVSWVHGCIGIYFWVRGKPYFRKISSLLLALAVILPTLSLLGLYQAGRAVERASAAPEWRADNLSRDKVGTSAEQAVLERISSTMLYGYFGLIGLTLAARGVRALLERRRGLVRLSYGSGKTVRVPIGLSVLEASTRFNIPHSSVCGGRARCSTCRIRIIGDCSALPEPSNREIFVLDRVGAGGDPAIRLACQLRPRTDVSFFQIFPAHTATSSAATIKPALPGRERYVVSMFVDMRGSTKLAEQLLPFDTVFIINRFLTAVSQAVVECGGQPNQFVGDGQLALFGLSTNPQTACRQAIEAASRIAIHVDALNEFLGDDVPEPLRFGIGIHGGEVIIGDIGSEEHTVFTALGDSVNVAARLQDMTKALSCEVVVSEDVLKTARLAAGDLPQIEVPIRGRVEPLVVYTVEKAGMLSDLAADFAVAAA